MGERNRIAVTALGKHVDVFEFSGGFNPLPPNGALSDGYEVTLVGTMTGARSSFGKFMAISGNSVIATGVPNYGYEKLYQQTICGDLLRLDFLHCLRCLLLSGGIKLS